MEAIELCYGIYFMHLGNFCSQKILAILSLARLVKLGVYTVRWRIVTDEANGKENFGRFQNNPSLL